jgi:hypothetical protein
VKIEVEVSKEDYELLLGVFRMKDLSAFLGTMLQETARTMREAQAMKTAGIPFNQQQVDDACLEVATRTVAAVSAAVCLYCGDPIHFELREGWVHENGEAFKKECGSVPGHMAYPKRDDKTK